MFFFIQQKQQQKYPSHKMFYENSSLTKIHFLHIAKNYYIANKDPHFDLM